MADRDRSRRRAEQAQMMTEEERRARRARAQKKKKRQQRQRKKAMKIAGLILVIVAILVAVFFAKNYSKASGLIKSGLEAYEQGDYETANRYFTEAVEKDDSKYINYMYQGMALNELKLYDEANAALNKAYELVKNERDSEKQVVLRAMGIAKLYQGDYKAAIEHFDEAIKGKEGRYTDVEQDILFYKAETQDKSGDFVGAVMTYTQLMNSVDTADIYMLRGLEYEKVGDSQSAEEDLRTAIAKDKKNYEVYFALYEALMNQGKTTEAEAALDDALKLGGSKGEDLMNQGWIYQKKGDVEKAKEYYTMAVDKGYTRANINMAELILEQENPDYDEACRCFESYLGEVTDDAEAYNKYGQCLMNKKDYQKAEEIFEKGVALNDRLMDRYLSRNVVAAAEHNGHWDKALEYINNYLKRYADDEDAIHEKQFIETRVR